MRCAFRIRSYRFALQTYDQVRWGNWSRPDGSNTTWDNRLIPDKIIQEWDRKQRLRRAARAKRSTAIRIPGTLCVTDMMSFVRSEALNEIVEAQDTSILRKRIDKAMSDPNVVSCLSSPYLRPRKISLFPSWNRAWEALPRKEIVHRRAKLLQLFFKR